MFSVSVLQSLKNSPGMVLQLSSGNQKQVEQGIVLEKSPMTKAQVVCDVRVPY